MTLTTRRYALAVSISTLLTLAGWIPFHFEIHSDHLHFAVPLLLFPGFVISGLLTAIFLGGIQSVGELSWMVGPATWVVYFVICCLFLFNWMKIR